MNEGKYMVDTEKVYNEIDKDGVPYIEVTVYRVFNDGTKEFGCTACYPKPSDEPVEPEPTQLDRIEKQLAAMTADSVTVANVETAILEGVNEV